MKVKSSSSRDLNVEDLGPQTIAVKANEISIFILHAYQQCDRLCMDCICFFLHSLERNAQDESGSTLAVAAHINGGQHLYQLSI